MKFLDKQRTFGLAAALLISVGLITGMLLGG